MPRQILISVSRQALLIDVNYVAINKYWFVLFKKDGKTKIYYKTRPNIMMQMPVWQKAVTAARQQEQTTAWECIYKVMVQKTTGIILSLHTC